MREKKDAVISIKINLAKYLSISKNQNIDRQAVNFFMQKTKYFHAKP